MKVSGKKPVAVLVSGGLDSAILLANLLKERQSIHPLYISNGNIWEKVELFWLKRYLAKLRKSTFGERLKSLVQFDLSMKDIYKNSWSVTGEKTPDKNTGAEAVFLPGKNILLLAKAAVYCSQEKIGHLALAPLQTNPFRDARRSFFNLYEQALSQGLKYPIKILTPFLSLNKKQVMLKGKDLPLHLTFSCLNPKGKKHCGRCNKCEERKQAFRLAKIPDPTHYAC